MVDFLTTEELKMLAVHASASAGTILAGENVERAGELSAEVGNNVTTTLTAAIGELFPNPSEEQLASARCAIWSNDTDGVGRAGLFLSALNRLQRTITEGTADDALAALEELLFSLFVAARKLRRLPAECRFAHLIITDSRGGHTCARCGERLVQ